MDIETQTQGQDVTPVVTDTVTSPASSADVQAIETPNAAVAQEATVNAEDTVAESKLYAGKYKSVEDLEKSYTELQSKFTSTASEKAELSKILADAFASEPEPVVTAQPDYDEYQEETSKPDNAVTRDISVLKFVMSNPDADGAAMNEVLKNDPFVAQINGYEAKLRYAHAISQSTAKPKAVEEAKRQTQIETQAKFAEKQAAQVESASKQSPPTQEEPLTREQIQSALRDDKSFGELLKKRPGFSNYLS